MGQYYYPIIIDGSEITFYNRKVNGKHTGAKLMEHSWWDNDAVARVCGMIYQHPCRIVWLGDYCDEERIPNTVFTGTVLWAMMEGRGEEIKVEPVYPENKLLVNHDKKCILDLEEYKKHSAVKENGVEFVVHPIPLLTNRGNNGSGGDYYGENMDDIGIWAGDLISVEENTYSNPEYEKFLTSFKEGSIF